MSRFCIIEYGFTSFTSLSKGWHASIISKTSAHVQRMVVTISHDSWPTGPLGVLQQSGRLSHVQDVWGTTVEDAGEFGCSQCSIHMCNLKNQTVHRMRDVNTLTGNLRYGHLPTSL